MWFKIGLLNILMFDAARASVKEAPAIDRLRLHAWPERLFALFGT